MGLLTYDSALKVEFDDRSLAHLQIVINAKLRRGESFFFSWTDDNEAGDGRSAIWIAPSIPIALKFYGSRMARINPAWIDLLTQSANSNQGLRLMPEPITGEAVPGS